jgi:hypothetical protein
LRLAGLRERASAFPAAIDAESVENLGTGGPLAYEFDERGTGRKSRHGPKGVMKVRIGEDEEW